VSYFIYGAGSLEARLKGQVKENDQIFFEGFVDNIESKLREIGIVVVPSIIPESFSLISAEALSHGIPVITTDIGGQKEVVLDNQVGFTVPIEDAKSIAEKIDYLIDNPIVYNDFSKNALKTVNRFSPDQFKTQIQNCFSGL